MLSKDDNSRAGPKKKKKQRTDKPVRPSPSRKSLGGEGSPWQKSQTVRNRTEDLYQTKLSDRRNVETSKINSNKSPRLHKIQPRVHELNLSFQ